MGAWSVSRRGKPKGDYCRITKGRLKPVPTPVYSTNILVNEDSGTFTELTAANVAPSLLRRGDSQYRRLYQVRV